MNYRSQIMKEAHAVAREMAVETPYRERLSLALKGEWEQFKNSSTNLKDVKMTEFTKGSEKQIAWAAQIRKAEGPKVEKMLGLFKEFEELAPKLASDDYYKGFLGNYEKMIEAARPGLEMFLTGTDAEFVIDCREDSLSSARWYWLGVNYDVDKADEVEDLSIEMFEDIVGEMKADV